MNERVRFALDKNGAGRAKCTCGWSTVHRLRENLVATVQYHFRFAHGNPETASK
jgi:hypothetical protein